MKLHSCADDTQLYKHTDIWDMEQAKQDMIAVITDTNDWSHSCRFKLNA